MPSDVYLEALRQLVERHHTDGAFGVLLANLPDVPVRELADALGGPSEVVVSLVGVKDADALVRWARDEGWDEARFGAADDATHAVRVRNDNSLPDDIVRLAVVQGEGARLGSLEDGWYHRLGTDEIVHEVCRLGHERSERDPLEDLWDALASEAVASYLSLEQVVAYHDAVFADPDDTEAPREHLPLLGLLRDPQLLTGSRNPQKRLLENASMVERLLQPADQDEAYAAQNVRRDETLRSTFRAFKRLRRGDLDAVGDLTLPKAHDLFAELEDEEPSEVNEPTEDGSDDAGRNDAPPSYEHPAQAAVDLAAEGEDAHVQRLLGDALRHLSKDRPKQGRVKTDRADFHFTPDAHALAFTRATVGEERYGGTLISEETLDDVLTLDKPESYVERERFDLFDAVRMEKLFDYLRRARNLVPGFKGRILLAKYLDKRAALTRPALLDGDSPTDSSGDDEPTLTHADVLAHDQLAFTYLVAHPEVMEAVRAATHAYQRFLSHLNEHFLAIHEDSSSGAARIVSSVLALDLIVIHSKNGETGALLSPLSPLVLWKHHAVAQLVRERREKLSEADRHLLHKELRNLPEPLLSLHAPSAPDSGDEEGAALIHAGRIGSLPLYRSSTVEVADAGADSLQRAAQKLAALYPPARRNLRVVLLNPRSMEPAAKATRALLDGKNDFDHVTLLTAHLGRRGASQQRSQSTLGNALDELHADGRVTLETVEAADVNDLAKTLRDRPAHLLVVAGEQQRAGGVVRRETTRLHPLSIPKRLEADGITGELSLQPRSNRPPEDEPHHPYGLYHDAVSALTRKPRRDHTLREHQRVSLAEHEPLLAGTSFYVLAGTPAEGPGENGILRLTQSGGAQGDTVFTQAAAPRIVQSVKTLVTQDNYAPTDEGIRALLRRIEEVGGEGLFSAVTPKAPGGFSEPALKGHIGLAVALGWYEAQAQEGHHLVLSLDSPLARQWLGRREESRRADLLGFRRTPDGTLAADVVEVKSYAATGDARVEESEAAEQLRETARVLTAMLSPSNQGDLLTDCRRELLRLQVYREGLLNRTDAERPWVRTLNKLLDGEADVTVDRVLVEVLLAENKPQRDERSEDGAIRHVELAESAIQQHLSGILDPSAVAPPAPEQPPPEKERSAPEAASVDSASSDSSTDSSPDRASGAPSPSQDRRSTAESHDDRSPENPDDADEAASPEDPSSADGNNGDSDHASSPFAPNASEREDIAATAKGIYKALEDHRINLSGAVDPEHAEVGPNVVRHKVRLQSGERLSRLQSATKDLMRELALPKEPIVGNLPGTSLVHIDVPRSERKSAPLRPVLERATDRSGSYAIPAGVRPDGTVRWLSIPKLPHMLVAGATRSGKSVFLRSLVMSLAYLNAPETLQLVLIDEKRVDFGVFSPLPHLRGGRVINEADEALDVLTQLVEEEMERRTQSLEEGFYLNIQDYNTDHPDDECIPPIVVVIDEYAELCETMPGEQREAFESAVKRLAQRARNVGIHLVLATQRPTADIVEGTTKANLPCRVSFRLESNVDSRTILDQGGAEHLLGRGDMLLRYAGETTRLQGLFSDSDDLRKTLRTIMQRHEAGQ